MTATTSIYDGDYDSVDIDDDNSFTADKESTTRPRGKTLTFLKELRNIKQYLPCASSLPFKGLLMRKWKGSYIYIYI